MLVAVDWPLYPRLGHTTRASNDAQCGACALSLRAQTLDLPRFGGPGSLKVIEVTPQG